MISKVMEILAEEGFSTGEIACFLTAYVVSLTTYPTVSELYEGGYEKRLERIIRTTLRGEKISDVELGIKIWKSANEYVTNQVSGLETVTFRELLKRVEV